MNGQNSSPKNGANGNPWLGLLGKLDPTTAILVAVMGGGNLLATFNGNDTSKRELDRAIREVHEIHDVIDSTVARQKEMVDILRSLKRP
jgi:hypothetical protein